jgi:hypothetical protein
MFERRSKASFFGALLGVAYAVYSVVYWSGAADATSSDDLGEAIGAGLALAFVFPHMVVTVIGAIFAVIGFFTRSTGLTLTGAILFSSAALLFLLYAAFLIPSIILGFVGYANQKKMNRAHKAGGVATE